MIKLLTKGINYLLGKTLLNNGITITGSLGYLKTEKKN